MQRDHDEREQSEHTLREHAGAGERADREPGGPATPPRPGVSEHRTQEQCGQEDIEHGVVRVLQEVARAEQHEARRPRLECVAAQCTRQSVREPDAGDARHRARQHRGERGGPEDAKTQRHQPQEERRVIEPLDAREAWRQPIAGLQHLLGLLGVVGVVVVGERPGTRARQDHERGARQQQHALPPRIPQQRLQRRAWSGVPRSAHALQRFARSEKIGDEPSPARFSRYWPTVPSVASP